MYDSILSAIGNTPLVKLERDFDDLQFNLNAK
jgi:cysteine synthase